MKSMSYRMYEATIAATHLDGGEYVLIARDEPDALSLLGEILHGDAEVFHHGPDRQAVTLTELPQGESFTVVYADLDRPDAPPRRRGGGGSGLG
jgi:hypothetical protein